MAQEEATSFDFSNLLSMRGQGVVVLGAGQGIGEQSCLALANVGAQVLCVDSSEEHANRIAERTGGEAFVGDVTSRESIVQIFERADSLFGKKFHGVVDVVGVASLKPIADFSDNDWYRQFDIVVKHAFMTVQVAGAMLARNGGGSMTFIGSLSGLTSVPNQAIYGSSKAALHHFVRCAAHEYGPKNVRINAISPGFTRTPRLEKILPADGWRQVEESIPLRRAATVGDIASGVLYLQSPLSRYVTANVLVLDGGSTTAAAIPNVVPKI